MTSNFRGVVRNQTLAILSLNSVHHHRRQGVGQVVLHRKNHALLPGLCYRRPSGSRAGIANRKSQNFEHCAGSPSWSTLWPGVGRATGGQPRPLRSSCDRTFERNHEPHEWHDYQRVSRLVRNPDGGRRESLRACHKHSSDGNTVILWRGLRHRPIHLCIFLSIIQAWLSSSSTEVLASWSLWQLYGWQPITWQAVWWGALDIAELALQGLNVGIDFIHTDFSVQILQFV